MVKHKAKLVVIKGMAISRQHLIYKHFLNVESSFFLIDEVGYRPKAYSYGALLYIIDYFIVPFKAVSVALNLKDLFILIIWVFF
jgi:hypothetical protein